MRSDEHDLDMCTEGLGLGFSLKPFTLSPVHAATPAAQVSAFAQLTLCSQDSFNGGTIEMPH